MQGVVREWEEDQGVLTHRSRIQQMVDFNVGLHSSVVNTTEAWYSSTAKVCSSPSTVHFD